MAEGAAVVATTMREKDEGEAGVLRETGGGFRLGFGCVSTFVGV